jgi:hypothetical protein
MLDNNLNDTLDGLGIGSSPGNGSVTGDRSPVTREKKALLSCVTPGPSWKPFPVDAFPKPLGWP